MIKDCHDYHARFLERTQQWAEAINEIEKLRAEIENTKQREKAMLSEQYITQDISVEIWREYNYGEIRFRVNNPKTLVYRKNGSTHRVIDMDDIVHCFPVDRPHEISWSPKDKLNPIQF